jgi:hypothetical protein
LRNAATSLSYNIVVLDELRMTETEFRKLFKDMDAIADDPAHDPADYQIAFRRLQKERFPNLTREQFLDLFKLWGESYSDKLEAAHKEAVRKVIAFAEAAAKIVPRGKPFVCVCGVKGDPSDPAFERIHAPHVCLAGLDKITNPKSLVRWKMVR